MAATATTERRGEMDQAIIKETLEEVKAALRAVVYDTDMKKNRWGLWRRCSEALDHLEDIKPRLEGLLEPSPASRSHAEEGQE